MSTVILVLLLLTTGFASSALQLNPVLNTFKHCYTDVIFTNSSVPDIFPPTYPVLISTPQTKYSNTPSTIRFDVLTDTTMSINELPQFESNEYLYPYAIKVRFNCVAMVIVDAMSIDDIRRSIRFRHNWLHYTKYWYDLDGYPAVDEVFYTGPLFINLINTEEHGIDVHRAIWFRSPSMNQLPAIYMWNFRSMSYLFSEIELQITVIPPCGVIFSGKVNLADLTVNGLGRILASGVSQQCHLLIVTGGLRAESETGGRANNHFVYFGNPFKFMTLAYPSDPYQQQLIHKQAIFHILAKAFANSTVLIGHDPVVRQKHCRRCNLNDWIAHLHVNMNCETCIEILGEAVNIRTLSSTGLYLPTRLNDFKFMACELRVISVDFQAYLKPFGVEVWLCLCIVMGSSTIFLFIVFYVKDVQVNGFLLLYSFLLEHGHHIGNRLGRIRSFNTFMTMFLLMVIILQNAYKGIVISDITAPLQETHISTYEEASKSNFTILTRNTQYKNLIMNILVGSYRQLGYNLSESAKLVSA